MSEFESFDLGRLGVFDILITENFKRVNWKDAKAEAKAIGKGYRLPLDFELEELFKSSLFRGVLENASYWSGTETAQSRARSQCYRNGGDFRSEWFQHPGDIEDKDAFNYFFLVRKSRSKKIHNTLFNRILALALYDSIREKYHLNNYAKHGINRANVFGLYKQNKSKKNSFLSMLQWGGIRTANLNRVNAYRTRVLEDKLTSINALISKQKVEAIIDEYLTNPHVKISGVNLSFITKHLYFARPSKFVIYDRFMINLHVALLLEQDPGLIEQYFTGSNQPLKFSIRRKQEGKAYADFLNRFNTLYIKMNDELSKRGVEKFKSLGEFDAFLFGADKPRNSLNPRCLITDFITEPR
jgi:hypothetical protein